MNKETAIELVQVAIDVMIEEGNRHTTPYVALTLTLGALNELEGDTLDGLDEDSLYNVNLLCGLRYKGEAK